MMTRVKKAASAAAVGLTGFLVAGVASAETGGGIDTSGVVSYLEGDVTTAIGAVGGAIIVLAVIAMGFKWIKGMIFS